MGRVSHHSVIAQSSFSHHSVITQSSVSHRSVSQRSAPRVAQPMSCLRARQLDASARSWQHERAAGGALPTRASDTAGGARLIAASTKINPG